MRPGRVVAKGLLGGIGAGLVLGWLTLFNAGCPEPCREPERWDLESGTYSLDDITHIHGGGEDTVYDSINPLRPGVAPDLTLDVEARTIRITYEENGAVVEELWSIDELREPS